MQLKRKDHNLKIKKVIKAPQLQLWEETVDDIAYLRDARANIVTIIVLATQIKSAIDLVTKYFKTVKQNLKTVMFLLFSVVLLVSYSCYLWHLFEFFLLCPNVFLLIMINIYISLAEITYIIDELILNAKRWMKNIFMTGNKSYNHILSFRVCNYILILMFHIKWHFVIFKSQTNQILTGIL